MSKHLWTLSKECIKIGMFSVYNFTLGEFLKEKDENKCKDKT